MDKPMLAAAIDYAEGDLDRLTYPLIGSPKLDGIRCVKVGGEALSRTFKPIPNKYIRAKLMKWLPDGADGEIMSGNTFQDCTSNVMSFEGEPAFKFWMFDYVKGGKKEGLNVPYEKRLENLYWWFETKFKANKSVAKYVKPIPYAEINNLDELLDYEAKCLRDGFEGICLRAPSSPYKCGRSTFKQGWLLKLKRFVDAEAEIVGFVELMHNENEAKLNEVGQTKRSSAKAGKVAGDTLGTFKVRDLASGVEFEIGTGRGLTHDLRRAIWRDRDNFVGKIVKYRYQPVGVKDKPRIGSFLGFRDAADMGE